jgi:multimeric flavodoxin WrbA
MNMPALACSYRRNENYARIDRIIEARMRALVEEQDTLLVFKMISLGAQEKRICTGCRVCFDCCEGGCFLNDAVLFIRSTMDVDDGLLHTSPSMWTM